MIKVSFDFDGTTTNPHIQKMMAFLIKAGFEVHITTQRWPEGDIFHTPPVWDNKPLFAIADELGIPQNHIHFMGMKPKKEYFMKHRDFLFHLDDDFIEVDEINEDTFVKGILFDGDWEENIYNTFKTINIQL
jgi:hypothetical protein